jgi:hypothetical protein
VTLSRTGLGGWNRISRSTRLTGPGARLGGVPLAIELAAARVNALGVTQLLEETSGSAADPAQWISLGLCAVVRRIVHDEEYQLAPSNGG